MQKQIAILQVENKSILQKVSNLETASSATKGEIIKTQTCVKALDDAIKILDVTVSTLSTKKDIDDLKLFFQALNQPANLTMPPPTSRLMIPAQMTPQQNPFPVDQQITVTHQEVVDLSEVADEEDIDVAVEYDAGSELMSNAVDEDNGAEQGKSE